MNEATPTAPTKPKKTREVNLLQGGILSSLTRLALPIMASALIQMAYNLVDMVWIGYLGYQPVAAVGAAGMFIWFGDGLLMLSRIGGQVYVGQAIGRADDADARGWAVASFQLSAVIALVYASIQLLFAPQLIGFFRFNEAATIRDGITYLRLVAIGFPFAYIARNYTGLVTVRGQSHISMKATIIGLVLNIILDPVCIFIFGWGVAGAAIATVFSQFVVFIVFLYAGSKIPLFQKLPIFREQLVRRWGKIIRLGAPTSLQNMFYAAISMILGRLVSSFGDAAISIQKVGSQVESISWMTAEGFAVALTAFMAQNYGAGQIERTKEGYKKALLLMTGLGLLNTLLLCGFPGIIFQAFIRDPAVIPGGISYLFILGLSQFFMCMEIMTAAAFAGLGRTMPPAVVITLLTGARIPLAYALASTSLGVDGVWWAISLSSIAKGIVLVVLFTLFFMRAQKRRQFFR